MPQKAKFSKEEIINAAVSVVESDGVAALTARTLGKKLGSSARPIFTVFDGMDEVMRGVTRYASALYKSYVAEGLTATPAFKGVGTAYVRFAGEHPKLFRLLFMNERDAVPDTDSVLEVIEESYDEILHSITGSYGVDEVAAKRLYLHMWIYTHGIATLTVDKTCRFGAEEISAILTEVFKGLIKGGKYD